MNKTITAKRVSYPNSARRWVQDQDDNYYSWWGNEVWGKNEETGEALHGSLVQDEEYELEWDTTEKNGRTFNNVTAIKRLTYRQTGATEAEDPEQESKTSPGSKPSFVPAKVEKTVTEPQLPVPTVKEVVVLPQVSAEQALANWKVFSDLKVDLLEPSDYIYFVEFPEKKPKGYKTKKEADEYNSKTYRGEGKVMARIKKSGWRKLSTAFNLTVRVTAEIILPQPPAPTEYAKYWVLVIAPNGRSMPGIGVCSLHERGFAKQDHDIPATAMTRAVNRGISDLIAAGEISAEEVEAAHPKKEEDFKKKLSDVIDGVVVGEGKEVKPIVVEKPKFTTTDPCSKEKWEECKAKLKEVADKFSTTQKSVIKNVIDLYKIPHDDFKIKRAMLSVENADKILEYLSGQL